MELIQDILIKEIKILSEKETDLNKIEFMRFSSDYIEKNIDIIFKNKIYLTEEELYKNILKIYKNTYLS